MIDELFDTDDMPQERRTMPAKKGTFRVDAVATEQWEKRKTASGYRVQSDAEDMPEYSADMWYGSNSKTMPGTSSFANLSNAIEDMVFGRNESVTGENYSNGVRSRGALPMLLVLIGKEIDAPGAEIVVNNAKIAGAFTENEVREAMRKSLAKTVLPEDSGKTLDEILKKYDIDYDDYKNIEAALIATAKKKLIGKSSRRLRRKS